MDAVKKPTGMCLWRPADYTKCAQMRFRDLNNLNFIFPQNSVITYCYPLTSTLIAKCLVLFRELL